MFVEVEWEEGGKGEGLKVPGYTASSSFPQAAEELLIDLVT